MGGLQQGREKTMTLKRPISARHPIDSCVLVRPQFHVSRMCLANETRGLVSPQSHLIILRMHRLHFCGVKVANDLSHNGFVIDMRLDAIASQ